MIIIDNILVSDEIKNICFACDLKACKGACCVEGDAGAPLEEEEISILEDFLDKIRPYMSNEGVRAVSEQGVFDYDSSGEFVTPLIENRECAFTIFDENGIASCAIEKAWEDKKQPLQKPISCHLYPVRIKKLDNTEGVNYHRWNICEKALAQGKREGIYLHEFLGEALSRKYGTEWYRKLTYIIHKMA